MFQFLTCLAVEAHTLSTLATHTIGSAFRQHNATVTHLSPNNDSLASLLIFLLNYLAHEVKKKYVLVFHHFAGNINR